MKKIYHVVIITMCLLSIPLLSLAEIGSGKGIVEIKEGVYSSSLVCGKCHLDIYNQWRESLHAAGLTNPAFRTAYLESYMSNAEESKQLCLSCHAPAAVALEDFQLEKEVSKEGITCDLCHSIIEVQPSPSGFTYKSKVGQTKVGPWPDVESKAHKTLFSPLQTSAQLCATCHEYVNKNKVSILSTYSEWKEGPYAKEGVQCQGCHMPSISGVSVGPEVKEVKRKEINLHLLEGGHSIAQLKKAMHLEIVNIEKLNTEMKVTLNLANVGSGHMVPSGIPSRRLVLTLTAQGSSGQKTRETVTYQKILVDKDGNRVFKDSEVFTKPTLISKDNRIAPKETRKEVITLPLPSQDGDIVVRAELNYVYEPLLIEKKEISLELVAAEKVVPRSK